MRSLFTGWIICLSAITYADGISELTSFIAQSRSLSAQFTQTITTQAAKKPQTSTGHVLIQRPGKFHWHYKTPYPSEIIGDGQKVWLYDPELKQVTVKKMEDAIESSPAALLSGNNNFGKHYLVQEHSRKNNITRLQATPKAKDSTFQQIYIGLHNNIIQYIELIDQLGQTTTIVFDHIILNPKVNFSEFTFIPPKGVDIISE